MFDEIHYNNIVSRNILWKGLCRFGELESAQKVFDEMRERDVVSWNSMISAYVSCGLVGDATGVFSKMQSSGVWPSEYTFSIVMSAVSCGCHGKEVHGGVIKKGVDLSNVVVGNSLIGMYGRIGLVDYGFRVSLSMEEVDVVTLDSLIWSCHRAGYEELAVEQFVLTRETEHCPDEFTVSNVINVCCNLLDLARDWRMRSGFFKS